MVERVELGATIPGKDLSNPSQLQVYELSPAKLDGLWGFQNSRFSIFCPHSFPHAGL